MEHERGQQPHKKIDNSVDDVAFISTLPDNLIADYQVDSKRVFCTGISRGGIFSLYLAWQLSERIAAIAPVCASIPDAIAGDYSFKHPTPVLLINGTEDPLINYNGGAGKMNGVMLKAKLQICYLQKNW